MLKVFSLCLPGGQPAAPKSPAAQPLVEPAPVEERRSSIGCVERQWQALYDGLHTVRGPWHERLGQVMGLAAACCSTAFVSAHLFCPYQSCFVVMSSGGPLAELHQPGDLHPADLCVVPASLHTGRLHTAGYLGPTGSGSASALEATSLQLLLSGKVTVYRSVGPGTPPPPPALRAAATAGAGAAEPAVPDASHLPPDWRRFHNNAGLTEFAALPILDSGGSVVAALSMAGPAAPAVSVMDADAGGSGRGGAPPRLSAQLLQLERFTRVLGLAFFSDAKQLPVHLLAASALAGVQRAETLQAMVESAHEGFGALLERHFRLEGAKCVLALADSMEARVAYFGPPPPPPPATGTSGPSATGPRDLGSAAALAAASAAAASLSRALGSCSSQQGPLASGGLGGPPTAPLQGVLGPLMDTLLLEVVSREGPGNGRVITNCRAYLQQEDKPGRDVQVCFQLCRMPPACLALAVVGAAESTLAPEVALYVCTAQPQLPGGLLEEVRSEAQCVLQLLMPHIHRQLLGPLASEWAGMRLQAAAAGASSVLTIGGGGAAGQSGGGEVGSVSVNSVLAGHSGGLSLGGLCRTVSFTVDDVVSHSPAHLKVVVAGIQSTITSAQMNQAWQAAGDTGTRESIDDLYSIRLRETVGQGGQGVVFRGLMHGLEVAVKVVAKDMPGALIAKVQQQQQQQAAAAAGRRGGGGAGGGGAAAGAATGGGGAASAAAAAGSAAARPVDPEQLLRTAKRELIRDALELAVTSAVNHPHIVQVHNYFFDVLVVGYAQEDGSRPPDAPGGTPPSTLSSTAGNNYLRLVRRVDATEEMVAEGPTNLVIVMEYCDAGTLKDVLRRGYFKRGVDANGWPRLDLTSMYICLLEVALALRHMHSLALVHCDLKPSNVLLRSHPRDPRGWTCKLSDFGCVRMLKPVAEDGTGPHFPHFTVTRALGTLTHMAPEVISKGALLTSSVDVYSFGIMMAELVTGVPQDQCMPGKEAIQLARKGVRPNLPPYCPKEYRDVATACWSHDPHTRPTAAELVNVLQMLLNQAQGGAASSNSFGHMLPQVLHHQLAGAGHGRMPGALPASHRAAAAAVAGAGPAMPAAPHGGRALAAAAAALAAAAMQPQAAASGSGAAAASGALVGTNININVTPLQALQAQAPPLTQPGSGAGADMGVGSAAATAAAARAFPGASPAQVLAAAAERVLVKGSASTAAAVVPAAADVGAAAVAAVGGADAAAAGAGGGGGPALNPQRALAVTLNASLQHHLMLQQVQQQMQLHQQAQAQQQAHVQVQQQILRQALQQHALQQQEQLAQLQAAQLQAQVQAQPQGQVLLQQQQQRYPHDTHHHHQYQLQLQRQVLQMHTLTQHAPHEHVPEPPTPQQQQPLQQQQSMAEHQQRQHQHPQQAVQEQHQPHQQQLVLQQEPAPASEPQPINPTNIVIGSTSGTSGVGAASSVQKPGSFTSAASAFSAVGGALSPTASSLSSSARQLPSHTHAVATSQPLPAARDAQGAAAGAAGAGVSGVGGGSTGGSPAPAAPAAPPPIVLPGSPIALVNTVSGQNSSPVRTEYDSPAEPNLSGPCSDAAAGQQRALTGTTTAAAASGGGAAATAAAGSGLAGLYASLDADLLFNTAGSNAVLQPSSGPEGAMVAAAAAAVAERGGG